MEYRHNAAVAASALLLVGASLMVVGCSERPGPDEGASVTVQLPPAHPYRPPVVKPGFSESLTGVVKG